MYNLHAVTKSMTLDKAPSDIGGLATSILAPPSLSLA